MDANPGLYLSFYLHVGAGTAVVFEGCAFVDTALKEVLGAGRGTALLTESKCEFFAAPSACTGAGADQRSLGLKRSEGG